jgi:diacylglycerol O-acyltransferase
MQQLTGHDARLIEADTAHSNANVTFVQIYDQSTAPGGHVRFKSILSHIESRLHLSPVFRHKLLRVPLGLDLPYWVEDEDFDLEYHVRHIALPQPGDWRQFCIQASRIHARALDPQRPLWEIYVIEGLDSITDLPPGSFALLTKIHHAAADLDSGNTLVDLLHDTTRKPPKAAPAAPWFPERAPGTVPLLWRSGLHAVLSPLRLLKPLQRGVPKAATFLRDWLRPERAHTATRFSSVVSAHRVFDTRRFFVEEFDRIRSLVSGASLNDAVLAVCAGGLRAYLDSHAELPAVDLTATVPLGAHQGTAVSGATRQILLGTHIADPVQRLAWIQGQTREAAPISNPRALRSAAPASCTISAVRGPAVPVFLHGARMTYFSAILPIRDGQGLVFAVTVYDGRVVISPTSCRELMPDPQAFTQCVRDCFQQMLALAPPPATTPATRSFKQTAAAVKGQRRAVANGTANGTAKGTAKGKPMAKARALARLPEGTGVKPAKRRVSAPGTPRPKGPRAGSAASAPAAAKGARRRSTAPRG